MKKVQIVFSLFFLFSFSLLYSQNSGDSLYIRYFNDQNPTVTKQLDTSLSNLYLYRPNSSFQNFSYNLGNIGSAFVPLTFLYNRADENIFRAFRGYIITSDSVKYFKTQRPYTEFNYTQGLTTEHFPGGLHTQRLNKNLGLSTVYQALSSLGAYQHQKTRGIFFYVALDFTSNNRKFSSYLNFVYNKLLSTENGGLTLDSDTSFRDGNSKSNRQLFATGLNNTNNTITHRGVSWKNYWYFIGPPDSVDNQNNVFAGLCNETNVFSSYALFKTDAADINSGYLESLSSDSIVSDSMNFGRIDNFFGVVLGKSKGNITPFLKLGWRQQWNNHESMNSGFAEVDLKKEIADSVFLNAFAQYGVNGRRSGDLRLNLEISKIFKSGDVFNLNGSYAKLQASYFDDYSSSATNIHNWSNHFQRNSSSIAALSYSFSKLKLTLEGSYQGIGGYIYFDENANLMQNNTLIHTFHVGAFKVIQHKWFRARSYIRYQNSSSYLILMPDLMARQEISFLINHKAIHAEVGFLATYFTSYSTYAYEPSLRDYYFQSSFKSGNYPFLDFYAALKVGPTRIFFKVDHFNARLNGNNYELLPYYPMNDLTFKLGIKWGFWN
ncbi:MAG: hypothetical protein NT150_03265 [Bacteroidetes bacterium]|nr:hypothetical protein [Bacteroidota bacterium]